jgi:DNA invertase Pin-like site-specific DNA recombinase
VSIQPKVAIYARVSTDEQTVDPQLRDLREYARSRGWENVREFQDVGISGAKDSRPGWNDCWDSLQKGRVNILLVSALDRIGRSLPHLTKIVAFLAERDIALISFRENIDLSTATGRLVAGIFSVLASYELNLISERTKAGLRAAKAKGKQVGNPKRVFDKEKATELRDQGWGQIRIAKHLKIGVGRVNEWARDEYLPPALRVANKGSVLLPE